MEWSFLVRKILKKKAFMYEARKLGLKECIGCQQSEMRRADIPRRKDGLSKKTEMRKYKGC